jgi:hypothetical protein
MRIVCAEPQYQIGAVQVARRLSRHDHNPPLDRTGYGWREMLIG